jgi:hypothetical protein
MAYPFGQWPTWAEMIHTLGTLGVTFKTEELQVLKRKVKAQYFEHKMDGVTIRCEVCFTNADERLTPQLIRYLCNRLQINPRLFGLHLG